MTIKSLDVFRQCCEKALERASYALIAAHVGATEKAFENWLSCSKADAAAHCEATSDYYFDFPPHGVAWFHQHIKRSRSYLISSLASRVVDYVHNGTEEICYNPADGRPLLALDPQHIGKSDDDLASELLSPRDRFLWEWDSEGNRVRPIYQTKVVKAPVQLAIKTLSSMIPRVWGERSTVDTNVSGNVLHIMEPAPRYVPLAERRPEVVEGEFTELPPPASRPDLEALLAEAERLKAEGPKNPDPDPEHPVRDVMGDYIGSPRTAMSRPDREDFDAKAEGLPPKVMATREHPKIVERPATPQKPPDYTGPSRTNPRHDPHNPNNRAANMSGPRRSITK